MQNTISISFLSKGHHLEFLARGRVSSTWSVTCSQVHKTNPRLISHQNVITFQMTGADACTRSLVLFHQLPTHPHCTNCGTQD